MYQLFEGAGRDPLFLAVRDEGRLADVRSECERLWGLYRVLSDSDFVNQFSHNFNARFWEMYLGVLLLERFPQVESADSGPDFVVVAETSTRTFIEATAASRGTGTDAVPDISLRTKEDDSVPFEECILRVTSSLCEKALSNNAMQVAATGAYVVAVNLPFPEAWLCGTPPLAAQATLGVGGAYYAWRENDESEVFVGSVPSIQKQATGSVVPTTAFHPREYDHVSALLVASVNPLSSSYSSPAIEFLHNPRATRPLPTGWLSIGSEYRNQGSTIECTEH